MGLLSVLRSQQPRAVTPSTRGLRSPSRCWRASIAQGPASLPGEQASAPGSPGPGPTYWRLIPKPVDPLGTTARDPGIRLHPPGCGNEPQGPLDPDPTHIWADMRHRATTACQRGQSLEPLRQQPQALALLTGGLRPAWGHPGLPRQPCHEASTLTRRLTLDPASLVHDCPPQNLALPTRGSSLALGPP